MKKTPDLIFIIDTNIDSPLAVAEAKKLGIPIIRVRHQFRSYRH